MSIEAPLLPDLRIAAGRKSLASSIRLTLANHVDQLGMSDILLERRPRRYILAYHRVIPESVARDDWCHPALWVSPRLFAEQLRFFTTVGRVVPLDELHATEHPSRPLFSITFDDAWLDNLEHAVPVLREHGSKATFFVATDAVSTGTLYWTESLAIHIGRSVTRETRGSFLQRVCGQRWPTHEVDDESMLRIVLCIIEYLKELDEVQRARTISSLLGGLDGPTLPGPRRIMTWSEVGQLLQCGHSIGSHTKTHRILKGASRQDVDVELAESRQILEAKLATPISGFCFPNARFDATSASRVLPNGYRRGYVMHNCPVSADTPDALVPRYSMSEANSSLPLLKARLLLSRPGSRPRV